ncbi:MAG: hypothetical protein AAF226_16490, partial [Verrucomicrobiota bacterium]
QSRRSGTVTKDFTFCIGWFVTKTVRSSRIAREVILHGTANYGANERFVLPMNMLEILQEPIKSFNLPFTIMLGAVLLYWIVAAIGLVEIDGGDGVDIDVDVDLDIDIDADIDVDADLSGDVDGGTAAGGFFHFLLKAVGASDAPIMLVLSIFAVMLWACNMLANIYFNATDSNSRATLLLIPVVIVAFILTRVLIRPLRPLMKGLRNADKPVQIEGSTAVVRSAKLDAKFGQIELKGVENQDLILNARLSDDSSSIPKGAEVLVISKAENEDDVYIVRPLSN